LAVFLLGKKERGDGMKFIGAVANEIGVSVTSLRRYELEGLIPKPERTITNRRSYTDREILAIKIAIGKKHQKVGK
jgi:DNA-binding transcriptional MerR regulator